MVASVVKKVKPKHGFAHLFHLSLVAVIPPLAYIFIRIDFEILAVAIVLLSKWRMFAVRPRHWIAHIRTNAVDMIVSLSFVAFMVSAGEQMLLQLLWLLLFEVWVLYVKPQTSAFMVGMQAFIAQALGLTAIFLVFESAPSLAYIVMAATVSYFAARHFFGSYDETHGVQFAWLWAYFSAALVWILSHWLLFYGPVAQPAAMLTLLGYGLAGLYYLNEHDKLTLMVRRQIMFVIFALMFVMIAFSNWGDGVIK